jgi:hypothetical protein
MEAATQSSSARIVAQLDAVSGEDASSVDRSSNPNVE